MAKTRVGAILRESMGASGQSTDLAKLTKDYTLWCKKINHLIQSLKGHLNSLQQIDKTRGEVSVNLICCYNGRQ